MKSLVIEPRDPLMFRDGKSFAAGLGATSRPFATPSAVAGTLRTRLGSQGGAFDPSKVEALLRVELDGPYLGYRGVSPGVPEKWKPAFAAPADAVVFPDKEDKTFVVSRLLPQRHWAGNCDLPGDFLAPLGFDKSVGTIQQQKPAATPPAFWTKDEMLAWLCGTDMVALKGIEALPRQRRIHVAISAETHAAKAGLLYSTDSIEFLGRDRKLQFSLLNQYEVPAELGDPSVSGLSHLGGEGRLAFWDRKAEVDWPLTCPLSEVNPKVQGIRLVLTTPAVFKRGWLPGWLDRNTGEGFPPCAPTTRVRLVSAAVSRYMPLSGWDFAARQPKPTRWLAPAGSVYFFELLSSNQKVDVSAFWMKSISDDLQERLDGFGRVLTGVFNL